MTKLLVFILVLMFIFGGFKPLIRFVKNAFGFKDEPKEKTSKEQERLTRSKQDLSQKKKKYFNDDDGEYTEYEEVK